MICEICHKNSATIHVQEILNGQKKNLYICPECAADKTTDNSVLQGINIAKMLYNLSEQISSPTLTPQSEATDQENDSNITVTCTECKWDTSKFRQTGRLGCPACYDVFSNVLNTALQNMHRGTLHVGKQLSGDISSHKNNAMMGIVKLQQELEELILREEYEKAAIIRDKINKLKKDRN